MYVWEFYPPSGRCKLIRFEGEQFADASRGFYVETGDVLVGLYASERGPVFFVDDCHYVLKAGQYHMELSERTKLKVFRLAIQGRETFSLEYEKPGWIDDSLVDEETSDFFLWLYRRQNTHGLHAFFTL